jgi:hypothetical protein
MIKDRVAQFSNVSGSGNITLDGAVEGRLTLLDAGYEYGDTVRYVVEEPDGSNFGKFEGVFTSGSPDYLTRGTFLGSLTGEPVDFSTATNKLVFVDASASLLAADKGRLNIGVTAGTAAAYTIALPVPVEQLKNGVEFWAKINADNTSADVTIAPDGKDPKPIKHGTPLRKPAIGALKTGARVLFKFSESDDCWVAVLGLVKTTKTIADATYTVVEEDHGQRLLFTATCAVTIPESTGQFAAPFEFDYLSDAAISLTPTTSTINGNTSLQGSAGQFGTVSADGGNYRATATAGLDIAITGTAASMVGGVDSNSVFSVSFSELVLRDSDGVARQVSATISGNISIAGISGLDTGAEANSTFYAIWAVDQAVPVVKAPVTAAAATDRITHTAHGLLANTPVVFGGTAPGGLTAGTTYYIRDVTTNDYKVAASPGGAAIDLTSAGADLVVSTRPALLFSTSATAPTLPSTCGPKALIATVLNNSSGNFIATTLLGRKVTFADQAIMNNAGVTSVGTWQTVNLSSFVPSWAKSVSGNMGRSDSGNNSSMNIAVASDTAGTGSQKWGAWNANAASALDGFFGCGPFIDLRLSTAQTMAWTAGGGTAGVRITINGFEI